MTRDQLLAAVPTRLREGMLPHVRLADVPDGPWAGEFAAVLTTHNREPMADETGPCAFYRDWAAYVEGQLGVQPSRLAPDDEEPDLTPAQLRELVPVFEPCSEVPARHVRVLDVPRPHRTAFMDSMRGSTVPFRPGESALGVVYAHDWNSWLAGCTPGWEAEKGRRRP